MENFLLAVIFLMFVLALSITIYLWRKTHFSLGVFALGVLGFALPVMFLEGPINAVILPYLSGSIWLTIVYGALIAGLVEESSRYMILRHVAKKRVLNDWDGVAYGLGHGLSEYVLLGLFSLLTSWILLHAIQTGQHVKIPQVLVDKVVGLTELEVALVVVERVFALILQIALSILVYLAVRKGQKKWYFLAMLLHMSMDLIPGIYQSGVIHNIIFVESLLAMFVILVTIFVYGIWKKEIANGII